MLRCDVLPDFIPFDADGRSYYADSEIDKYLCEEYLLRFSNELRNNLAEVQISISKEFPNTHETELITRKAFLLSCTEVQINTDLAAVEGTPLPYSENAKNGIAAKSGENVSWGLRSTYTADQGLVWGISPNGNIGGGAVQTANGVRPAICLLPSHPVIANTLENGTLQYTLSFETTDYPYRQ